MTKKEFIKRAMELRPTAKQWQELVERAISYNNVTDYKNAESGVYTDVYPLAGAIFEHFARNAIYGSSNPATVRATRKRANIIHCCI